jgi:hypothetical protein
VTYCTRRDVTGLTDFCGGTASTHIHRLEFKGSGAEYFRIWTVNLALSILTLGINSASAKVGQDPEGTCDCLRAGHRLLLEGLHGLARQLVQTVRVVTIGALEALPSLVRGWAWSFEEQLHPNGIAPDPAITMNAHGRLEGVQCSAGQVLLPAGPPEIIHARTWARHPAIAGRAATQRANLGLLLPFTDRVPVPATISAQAQLKARDASDVNHKPNRLRFVNSGAMRPDRPHRSVRKPVARTRSLRGPGRRTGRRGKCSPTGTSRGSLAQ